MARYEFTEGSSSKFWEIDFSGSSFTTTHGRIGSDGRSTTKDFASPAAAKAAGEKLIAQKTKKGYVKVGAKKKAAAKTKKPVETDDEWQRYELVEGSSSKFWEVKVDGSNFSTRYGRIGTEGKVTTKAAKSARDALAQAKKAAEGKAKKGYKLVGGALGGATTVAASNPSLEKKIAADPTSVDEYLVYADWLQGEGDPRGELIVLHHKKMAKKAKKLIEDEAGHFFGPLAEYRDMLDELEWFMGFIKSAKVLTTYERAPGFGDKGKTIPYEEVLADFLDLPSARFIQHLKLGIESFDGNSYGGAAKIIAKRKLPTLKSLYVGDFHSEETELNWSHTGDVSPIWKAAPNLEEVTLRSGGVEPGKINLAKLRSLSVISGGTSNKAIKDIAASKCPKLETLSLQIGQELKGKTLVEDLRPILTGKSFPKLTSLGLSNNKWADEVCAALPKAKVLPKLKRLDLSKGTMSDAGAEHLASNADRFAHLEELDVSENYLTDAGIKALKKICKKVVFKSDTRNWRSSVGANGQRDDGGEPDYRYIAAYE